MDLVKSIGEWTHSVDEATVNITAVALLWRGPAGVYRWTLENILESRVLPLRASEVCYLTQKSSVGSRLTASKRLWGGARELAPGLNCLLRLIFLTQDWLQRAYSA